MPTITVEIPDELAEQVEMEGDRLPELVANSLRQPPLSAEAYRHVLKFIASSPTPKQIIDFRPPPEMVERWRELVQRNRQNLLTPAEKKELDDYEMIEHIVVMLKAGALSHLTPTS
jgi:hypothetical protein